MGAHLIDGQFQSNKYPTTPRGKVPLSVQDKTAQDLLWEYAARRGSVDAEFSADLQEALRLAGFAGSALHVWTADSKEWVVARSAEDACLVYCAQMGHQPAKEAKGADWGTHPDHWSVLADAHVLKWREECPEKHSTAAAREHCPRGCDGNLLITRLTCAELIAKSGRSYLGSANV
jgi:hypothetical protein